MENPFQIFQHEEFGKIRTLLIDDEPYFAGKDVATALGYSNTKDAISRHVDAEDKKIVDLNRVEKLAPIADAVSGGWIKNEVMFINESGLYSLILSSKLPDAKKFKRWVTSEVLPQIRKTGSYSLPNVEKTVAVQNQPPVLKSTILVKALQNVVIIKNILEKDLGSQSGISSVTAVAMVEKADGVDLSEVKPLIPAAEHEIGYMNSTQLAKKVGLKSAQAVNKILLEKGFQEKDGNGGYKLTEKGKKYGEAMPYEKNGHTGYQIKWSTEILSFLQ